MAKDEIISPLDVRSPDDKPIDIIDYEFTYIGDKGLISVFPSMGDTVKEHGDRWEFTFGRNDVTETVYKTLMLTKVRVTKMNRIYIDPAELVQRVKNEKLRRLNELREKREREDAKADGQEKED